MKTGKMLTAIRCGRKLQQQQPKKYKLAPSKDGLQMATVPTGDEVLYCASCKGPVVDSEEARASHALQQPRCARAMGSAYL
jgi:hypothetical protein